MCDREKKSEGGGHRREAWWRLESAEKQIRVTLEDLREAKGGGVGGEMGTQL